MVRGSRLLLALICACSIVAATGAFPRTLPQRTKAATPKLTDAERAIANDSRTAIIATGISEKYFEQHYILVRVVNQPGDRRVVWKFSVNGYETSVSDVLGFYTKDSKRVDTHSVVSSLRRTTEIEKTVSRSAANRIMRQCIGRFAHPTIEFVVMGNEARLVLTAESARQTARRSEKEEREQEARERSTRSQNKQGSDVIENEGNNGPPIITGTVDLQSGKCTKGHLMTTP